MQGRSRRGSASFAASCSWGLWQVFTGIWLMYLTYGTAFNITPATKILPQPTANSRGKGAWLVDDLCCQGNIALGRHWWAWKVIPTQDWTISMKESEPQVAPVAI